MSQAFNRISRRAFLNRAAAAAASALLAPALSIPSQARPQFSSNPFTLGVASGDPLPDAVVLWTRLMADLADPETWGLSQPSYNLQWAIYDAEEKGKAVQSGSAIAAREKGYAVHVEVAGLKPGRRYRYRFWCGDEESPEGLTKTAPAPDMLAKLRFGFCSCAEYENELFHAYRTMAEDDLDFAVHLGDYIYEEVYEKYRIKAGTPTARRLQFDRYDDKYEPIALTTLGQFRRRYAEHKLDPDLQEVHRVTPWIVTWDDHEVENDYAGLSPVIGDPAAFIQKRINAYQAYFENMPLRLSSLPLEANGRQLYRSFDFGKLLRLIMLDERQYRDAQACRDKKVIDPNACPDYAKERQMLGQQQFDWLARNLAASPATWNVLAQGVMFAMLDARDKDDGSFRAWYDAWAGYPWAQSAVIELLAKNRGKNPIIISGDIHSHWVNRIRRHENGEWQTVAPEFVCTSISSRLRDWPDAARRNADTVVFHNGENHGYVLMQVTPEHLTGTMVMMIKDRHDPVRKPVADYSWAFRVTPGQPDPRRV